MIETLFIEHRKKLFNSFSLLLSAMEQPFILLLITFTVDMTQQAPSIASRFSKVDPGDDVTGNVAAVYTSESLEECVLR